jgi:hypothetical protein
MTDSLISLNGGMAMRTQANKIAQIIGAFPVIVKFTPGDYVVNVKRLAKIILVSVAILTFVIVALAGFGALNSPVGAAPFLVTALPVAMILAFLPFCCTFIRTKAPGVFSAFDNVAAHVYRFSALFTGKVGALVHCLAGNAAKAHNAFLESGRMNFKNLTALFAGNRNALAPSKPLTFNRAIKSIVSGLVSIGGKLFSAMFTGMFLDCHTLIIP